MSQPTTFKILDKKPYIIDEEFPMLPFGDYYHVGCDGQFKWDSFFSGQDVYICDRCNNRQLVSDFKSITAFNKLVYYKDELTVNAADLEPVARYVWVVDGSKMYSKCIDLVGMDLAKYHYPNATIQEIKNGA